MRAIEERETGWAKGCVPGRRTTASIIKQGVVSPVRGDCLELCPVVRVRKDDLPRQVRGAQLCSWRTVGIRCKDHLREFEELLQKGNH